jgi:formylglycine-generating enzyme required for sulfatase activity
MAAGPRAVNPDVFLSFPPDLKPWAREFRSHLEQFAVRVFLEDLDVVTGKSLQNEHQAQLDRAAFLVLVVTPEALVRPQLSDFWSAFAARATSRPDERVVPLMLVDAPLPPFLSGRQPINFCAYDQDSYRDGLARLLSALGKSAPPAVLRSLDVPPPPRLAMPPVLRKRLVAALQPAAASPFHRLALSGLFGLPKESFERIATSTPDCAASALLVLVEPNLPARQRALRVIQVLRSNQQSLEVELPGLAAIEQELLALAMHDQGDRALDIYLERTAELHIRTADYLGTGQLRPVYVNLRLQCEALAPGDEPIASGGEIEGLRPLVARPLRGGAAPGRRWLLRGDPGSGKSILLRWLAADLAREARGRLAPSPEAMPPGEPILIPIYFSLPQLMKRQEEPLQQIETSFRRSFPPHEVAGLRDALELAGQDGRLVVLLDGLDEVPAADRQEAADLAAHLGRRWDRSVVILSSRRIGLHHPNGFQIVDILPLDRDRRRELLAEWLGDGAGEADTRRAELVLHQLNAESGLWGLTDNPLYLTLIALLVKKGGGHGGALQTAASGDGKVMPTAVPLRRRCELYDRVFRLLLEGRHREAQQPMPNQNAVRGSLRFLAGTLTERDRHSLPVTDLEEILLQEEAAEVWRGLQQYEPWRSLPRAYLDEMATKTGILAAYEGDDWRFQHRAFREALVAESLAESLTALLAGGREQPLPETGASPRAAGWEPFFDTLRRRADTGDRWVEPYALCVEASADPDLVIRRIVGINRTFGLRALSGVHGLKSETLQEILELDDDWRRRRDVILKLSDLAGDPTTAVRLLEMVSRTTSNGNDFFFVEQALAEAARRWPELADLAQTVVGDLFSHLAPPDPTLFRTFQTGEEVRPLWCEVPAGSFLMGDSSSGPEEGPVHQVVFDAPFRLSAVPVTRRQYADFDPRHDPAGWLPDLPVVRVTWYAAQAFCRWLSRSGAEWTGARLPTEEEWEHACAAGGGEDRWWCGDQELDEAAWFRDNAEGRCHAVATRRASPLGLYDLHGNVHEWCLDRWRPDYGSSPGAGPPPAGQAGPAASMTPAEPRPPLSEDDLGIARPVRGGSFQDPAERLRRAARKPVLPWEESEAIGFRIVLPAASGSRVKERER